MNPSTLETFLKDPKALPKLESIISTFNIFEAIGAVRRELRHSDFIAFLFDQKDTHGHDDIFYRHFCTSFDIQVNQPPIITVLREWEHIDILIRDRANKIIIAIENKIDTSEHSDQLQRYRKIVDSTYPDYKRHYFFLTKTGEEPSDKHWRIASYVQIHDLINELKETTKNTDVSVMLQHYANMIERHFMPNNEIAQLCRQIYEEHRRAIDLIIEHKPTGGEDIYDRLSQLIAASPEFEADSNTSVQRLRFAVKDWDNISGMLTSEGWTASKRILLFEIQNTDENGSSVRLKLYLGPTQDNIRGELLEMAHGNPDVFRVGKRGDKWTQIYNKELLSSEDLELDDRLKILESNWNHFVSHDFPKIKGTLDTFAQSHRLDA